MLLNPFYDRTRIKQRRLTATGETGESPCGRSPFREMFALGAHPITQHDLSYIKHELEGCYTMSDFLGNDLEHELILQDMMKKSIDRAYLLKDFGTAEVLQEVLLDREDLGYHIFWSVLEDDTLVRGMQHLVSRDTSNIVRDGNVSNTNKLQYVFDSNVCKLCPGLEQCKLKSISLGKSKTVFEVENLKAVLLGK